MNSIEDILQAFQKGEITLPEAQKQIGELSLINIGHTRIDMQRKARTGAGEVIFGAGKTPEQIADIAHKLSERGERVLITRITDDAWQPLLAAFPNAAANKIARTLVLDGVQKLSQTHIAIVSAGTSDMSVAEEARVCAEFFGDKTESFYDCGVAGLHRLTSVIDDIRRAKVVIAIAGMEGALASVLAGLVKVPVIAVPTSVGYGASFGGLAALLAMMNSCANGVSVVNIDNGFGAAYNAHLINSI